jgi:tRNA (adenine57-N1/adenine58-N1)-methyltransferase
MIEAGDRVLLAGEGREFFVRAGAGALSTDKGQLDLARLIGAAPGDIITTHNGAPFTVRIPRPNDFFTHGKRSGAPMLPKDIGLVIAYTGMNRRDDVLDAGTGSGISAIYFGGIARSVKTYEIREEFSRLAQMALVVDAAQERFVEVHTHELIEREMTRSKRGTRPSTSVCHSGYITIARK